MREQRQEAYLAFLRQRRGEILERLEEAAGRSGRSAEDVLVLAVSKTVGVEELVLSWEVGYRAFGENRPQELRRKLAGIEGLAQMAQARFDMIGNLQTNKINQVIGKVELVHSVSSLHLARRLSTRSQARSLVTKVLAEVNVSGEESKSGFSPEEVRRAADELRSLPSIELCGLMTMAPAGQPDAARATFSGLRELREVLRDDTGLPLEVLSCGMSDDFQIAVEEGSTLVRLGRTVFDPNYVLK